MNYKHNIILLTATQGYQERQATRTDAAVNDAAAVSAAALRVRKHRERRKAGKMVVSIEIDEEFIDWLVEAELLERWCEDPNRIAQVVQKLLKATKYLWEMKTRTNDYDNCSADI